MEKWAEGQPLWQTGHGIFAIPQQKLEENVFWNPTRERKLSLTEESCWPYSWIFYYHQTNPLLTQTFFKGAKPLSIITILLRTSTEHLVRYSVMQMFTWLALKKEADRFIKRQADTQIPLWKIHHKFFLSARLLWLLSWTFQFRL